MATTVKRTLAGVLITFSLSAGARANDGSLAELPYRIDWENPVTRGYPLRVVVAQCPALPEEGGGWWDVTALRAWHYAVFDYYGFGVRTDISLAADQYVFMVKPLPEQALHQPEEAWAGMRISQAGRIKPPESVSYMLMYRVSDPFDDRTYFEYRAHYRTQAVSLEEFQRLTAHDQHPDATWSRALRRHAIWDDGNFGEGPIPHMQFLNAGHAWPGPTHVLLDVAIAPRPMEATGPGFRDAASEWFRLIPQATVADPSVRATAPYPVVFPQPAGAPICVQYQAERLRAAVGEPSEHDRVLHRAHRLLGQPSVLGNRRVSR